MKKPHCKEHRIEFALRTVFQGKVLSLVEIHNMAGLDTLNRDLHLMMLMYKHATDDRYIDHTIRIMRMEPAAPLIVSNHTPNKLTRTPIYKGSVTWNDVPTENREADPIVAFKNAYRAHLVIQASTLA